MLFDINVLTPLTRAYPIPPTAIGITATAAIPTAIPPPTVAPIAANPDEIPAADKPTTEPAALTAEVIVPNPKNPPPRAPIFSDIFSFSASDNFL